MRVDLNVGSATTPDSVTPKSAATRLHGGEGGSSSSGLASQAARVNSLAAAALNAPEVRDAKVEALRTQIAAGKYSVSPHQIAASMVDQLRTRKPSGG